jgi:hypothetical protein
MKFVHKSFFSYFLLTCLIIFSQSIYAVDHALYYVPNADNEDAEGFIRITNADVFGAFITIRGVDDAGNPGNSPITVELKSLESLQLNSGDLENGNVSKGIFGSFGNGAGDWRLFIESDTELQVMSYIRTPDGFLNDMHDVVGTSPSKADVIVPFFNPASNVNQVSRLRIANETSLPNIVIITAGDDTGTSAEEPVSIVIPPFQVAEVTAQDLENGMSKLQSDGMAGNGIGKWKLVISSTGSMTVMNLLQAGRYVSNLSGLSYDINQFDNLVPSNFYQTSAVAGNFNGWSGSSIFNFTNGSQWQQIEPFTGTQEASFSPSTYYVRMKDDWFVIVEGTDQMVKVKRLL